MPRVPRKVQGKKQGKAQPRPLGEGLAQRVEAATTPANWCTLDYESVRGLAETNFEGDGRYGIDNWAKGIPASNLLNHALEHLFKLLDGDHSEPHLEHAMWNLGKLRWMARNKPEMIDLPRVRKALGVVYEKEGKYWVYKKSEWFKEAK